MQASSSGPNSVIRAGLPPHGVCSSATSVLVVSSSAATEAPFWSGSAVPLGKPLLHG